MTLSNQHEHTWQKDAKGILVWCTDDLGQTIEWMGNAINNYAWGKGKLHFYKNGVLTAWYEGNMQDGKYNGHGSFHYENGDVYQGQWQDGLPSGYGILQSSDGKITEGDWQNGQRKTFFAFFP